jgi:hypothetical protein
MQWTIHGILKTEKLGGEAIKGGRFEGGVMRKLGTGSKVQAADAP